MRKRKLGKRILHPSLQSVSDALQMSGEQGRAIPGIQQIRQQMKAKIVEGAPSVPIAFGRTEMWTYTTRPTGEFLLYEADSWMRVRIALLTAGPVDVGSREQISPVQSGKGASLITGETMEFEIKKGERLFITSNSVNLVRVIVSPIPFGEQLLSTVGSLLTILRNK